MNDLKDLQCIFHELVDFHDGGFVTASVAVVRCREHSHYISFMRPVVAIHHQLMGSWDQLQVIRVVELLRNVLAEGISSTSGWDTPAASVIRVWPKQVANGSITNIIELVKFTLHVGLLGLCLVVWFGPECQCWGKDHHGDRRSGLQRRQSVGGSRKAQWTSSTRWRCHISAGIHHRSRSWQKITNLWILHLSDLSALVVASQNGQTVSVSYLQADQQSHGLNRVISSVHIVAHEQVIRIRGIST